MPITTFQTINSTDKLQSGFRAKFNANVALLITDITDNGDGTATVSLQGGTNFQIDLGTSFYTKAEVVSLIGSVATVAWGNVTGNVADQADVVGNFGIIDDIDNIFISCNFAVASGDTDNPFGAFPASGYSSFSVPGSGGTGWQLLVKEDSDSSIKFRTYSGSFWSAWITIGFQLPDVISATVTTSDLDVYTFDAAELLILNTYTRYPNFVAIVNGTQFFDIVPTYTGTFGSFTACTVQLHSNGSGGNAENTFIQFS